MLFVVQNYVSTAFLMPSKQIFSTRNVILIILIILILYFTFMDINCRFEANQITMNYNCIICTTIIWFGETLLFVITDKRIL